ncbi:MAG: peptidase S10 [Salinarimonadaceae bacterium]|nr:MAG: peptidase S10 [Salinarimonadaceae bacterium]
MRQFATALLFFAALTLAFAPLGAPPPASAQQQEGGREQSSAREQASARDPLPAAVSTSHTVETEEGPLAFTATAGSIRLVDDAGAARADIAYVAYLRDGDGDDGARRPITFAVNGGPGAASAYLNIGALGPWRLPVGLETITPSQSVDLVDNAETWLAFTDLVFVDPVGTGFSRLANTSGALRNQFLSIDGDIEALSEFVYRWLVENGRVGSPKYFVGESYGGFRGPLLAESLQTDYGLALAGMTLLSPVLDFGWREQPDYAPLPKVSLLPSLAAAAMERRGGFSREALAEVEEYAAGEYLADLMRGLSDDEALARASERVASLTGLDPDLVRRRAGRIDMQLFAREIARDDDAIASLYDAGVTAGDPAPASGFVRAADPVLDGLTAPLTSGMLALYGEKLSWSPSRRYILLNSGVSRAWSWGRGRSQPEAVSALRRVMALDGDFQLLVVHGYTDLVTPYFESALVLRQVRDFDGRVRLENYPGGHMFYTRDESRRAFRDDAARLYGGRAP